MKLLAGLLALTLLTLVNKTKLEKESASSVDIFSFKHFIAQFTLLLTIFTFRAVSCYD